MDIRVNGKQVDGFAEALPKGSLERLIQDCDTGRCPENYGLRLPDHDVVVMSKDLPRLTKRDAVTVDGQKAQVVFDLQNSTSQKVLQGLKQAFRTVKDLGGLVILAAKGGSGIIP